MLVVDLDGTLLRSDMLYESFWSAFRHDAATPFRAARALTGGRAALKRVLAARAQIDVTTLPYNEAVVQAIADWRARGGRAALVTASDSDLAESIAAHLGIFDEVFGSDGVRNLKASEKSAFLNQRFGAGRYAYMGDSAADLKVWPHTARAITVNTSPATRRKLRDLGLPVSDLSDSAPGPLPYLATLRPAHWLPSLAALLPLLTAPAVTGPLLLQTLLLTLCLALIATGAGITGDLLALDRQRADPALSHRPFASGRVPLLHGGGLALALIAAGLVLATTQGAALPALALLALVALRLLARPGPRPTALLRAAEGTLPLAAAALLPGAALGPWHLAFGFALALTAALFPPSLLRLSLLGGGILMLPTVLNGAPFLYFDSAAYIWYPHQIAHAALRLVTGGSGDVMEISAGRSLYYGLPTYLATKLSLGWALVWAQATTLGWLIALSCRSFLPAGWPRAAILSSIVLAALTPAGFFVGLLMPDIWAAALIIALALLFAARPGLSRAERRGLWAIIAFAALAHSSHLALLLSLTALLAVVRLLPRLRPHLPGTSLAALAGAILLAIAGQIVATGLTTRATGTAPQPLPHFTAHLVDLGPGSRLIAETCPASGYALCAYADRLPLDWISFMFRDDLATGVFRPAPPEVKRALVAEQGRFLGDVVAAYPLATLGGLALDGLAQLVTLSIEDVPKRPERAVFLADNFPPDLVALTQSSLLYTHPGLRHLVTALTYAGSTVALLALLAFLPQSPLPAALRPALPPALLTFAALLLLGIVLNALICGILASPYGRFQARVVWLLPFAALLFWSLPRPVFSQRLSQWRPIA